MTLFNVVNIQLDISKSISHSSLSKIYNKGNILRVIPESSKHPYKILSLPDCPPNNIYKPSNNENPIFLKTYHKKCFSPKTEGLKTNIDDEKSCKRLKYTNVDKIKNKKPKKIVNKSIKKPNLFSCTYYVNNINYDDNCFSLTKQKNLKNKNRENDLMNNRRVLSAIHKRISMPTNRESPKKSKSLKKYYSNENLIEINNSAGSKKQKYYLNKNIDEWISYRNTSINNNNQISQFISELVNNEIFDKNKNENTKNNLNNQKKINAYRKIFNNSSNSSNRNNTEINRFRKNQIYNIKNVLTIRNFSPKSLKTEPNFNSDKIEVNTLSAKKKKKGYFIYKTNIKRLKSKKKSKKNKEGGTSKRVKSAYMRKLNKNEVYKNYLLNLQNSKKDNCRKKNSDIFNYISNEKNSNNKLLIIKDGKDYSEYKPSTK